MNVAVDGVRGTCAEHLCDEVVPRLYLGCAAAACDKRLLEVLAIRHVLSIAKHGAPTLRCACPASTLDEHMILRFGGRSMCRDRCATMARILDAGVRFLEKWHGAHGHAVLVHCKRGHVRSAAVVALYLQRYHGMTADNAWALLERQRGTVHRARVCGFTNLDELQEGLAHNT